MKKERKREGERDKEIDIWVGRVKEREREWKRKGVRKIERDKY